MDVKQLLKPSAYKLLTMIVLLILILSFLGFGVWSCLGCSGNALNPLGSLTYAFQFLLGYPYIAVIIVPVFVISYLVSCVIVSKFEKNRLFKYVLAVMFLIIFILSIIPVPEGFGHFGTGIVVNGWEFPISVIFEFIK